MDRQAATSITQSDLECMLLDEAAEPKALPFSLLENITNGFSYKQEIGRGGFAVVYKGMLENEVVAVKRLSNTYMYENEFIREVECLVKAKTAKHKNVVRFLGYCSDTQGNMERFNGKLVMADVQERLLCFEYLPKGSLDGYIQDSSDGHEWTTRYEIIKGICEGLHSLHNINIMHLDLKPSNILMGDNFIPKITDFGLSRGYLAPEFTSKVITHKFDLYSLGVIIMEILTGEKGCQAIENILESWGKRLEISRGNQYLEQIKVCAEIGIECTNIDPTKRPISMKHVMDRLAEMESKHVMDGLAETESMEFKAWENSPRKEKEVEERLTKEKNGLEKEHIPICNELQKANEQRKKLENKLLPANSLMEEFKELQVEILPEKDYADRQAEEMHQIIDRLRAYDHNKEIKEAANNFDVSKQIGQGGCESVCKGFLRHTTVAIKKFNLEGAAGEREFNDEVETLCRMRHPNLVTVIGVCREAQTLVFEFLSNGSLEDCLQCKHQTKPLSWRMRIRIAADICTGLIFLHSNKPKGIAHGDLKPDNILLDTSFVCKLADFRISRRLNLTNTTVVAPYQQTNQIRGTMGYLDPAYILSGELTAQSDVYSFGVVLLRLLTGKGPLGLLNEVEAALNNEMLQDTIDNSAGEWPPEYSEELARLALRCCLFDRKERPDLEKEAWGVLQTLMNCPDEKCQPPPFFICPITQEIMRDPHIASDGFTYEGGAIKDLLRRGHKMSPTTYLSFTRRELIPNSALRFAIQEWQMQHEP